MTDLLHVITPGDHFSPLTGSAIPTVVDGLATGSELAGIHGYRHQVVLQAGTFVPRYQSAAVIEYEGVPAPTRRERYIDGALARVGVPRRGAARYYAPVAARLAEAPPSIVLAHNAPILPWLLRETEHATVLYAHNDVLRSYTRYEAARAFDRVARLICVSESLAAQTRARLPRSLRERVRVVPNGVDTVRFFPATLREGGPLRVMFVGRAIPEKGADILLEAAGLLGRADLEYVIVGSHGFASDAALSPFEQRLRELARRVQSPVRFEPFVARADLPTLLNQADVLVLPSRWADPCPLTVGEGLASGLPVIAARMGGIPEAMGDVGILFDPADPSELAAAIGSVVDDDSMRSSLGRAARQRAEQRDWAWAARELASVLDEIKL